MYMISDYAQQFGEEKGNEIMGKLSAAGVNMERLKSYQQAYQQAVAQQAYQQAQQEKQESAE